MTSATQTDFALIDQVARRAFAHMVAMIHIANHRADANVHVLRTRRLVQASLEGIQQDRQHQQLEEVVH